MREIVAYLKIQSIYLTASNRLMQIFTIKANKRNLKLINNPKYNINKKLQERIDENYLGDGKIILYKETLRELDTITIIYESKQKIDIAPKYYKLVSTIPDTTGCIDCIYKDINFKTMNKCSFMNKLVKEKKSCQYFKQRKIIKS